MKSKTLMAMAIASTFGWSAASFAGSSHQAVMPASPNESGENAFTYQQSFGVSTPSNVMGVMSDLGSGTAGGSLSPSATGFSMSGDESASIGTDDSLAAADGGTYADYYLVSWAPARADSWDYYVIDGSSTPQVIAITDIDADQLALVPSTSDEVVYELALIPMTFDDGGLSTSTGDLSGE